MSMPPAKAGAQAMSITMIITVKGLFLTNPMIESIIVEKIFIIKSLYGFMSKPLQNYKKNIILRNICLEYG